MSDILEKNAGFKWLRNLNKRDGTARNFVLLRKVIRLSNRLVAAEKDRDSWKAKAEANERDAERYRYLRDKEDGDLFMENVGSDLDRAIDAARSAEKEK